MSSFRICTDSGPPERGPCNSRRWSGASPECCGSNSYEEKTFDDVETAIWFRRPVGFQFGTCRCLCEKRALDNQRECDYKRCIAISWILSSIQIQSILTLIVNPTQTDPLYKHPPGRWCSSFSIYHAAPEPAGRRFDWERSWWLHNTKEENKERKRTSSQISLSNPKSISSTGLLSLQ